MLAHDNDIIREGGSTMQKYSIINELRERDAEAIDTVLETAFKEYMKDSDDGVAACEKWAGFEGADDMLCAMKVGNRQLDDWVNSFCLGCWEEYLNSGGTRTGCYENDVCCRGCCFRNISYACFFKTMFEDEFDDICKELSRLNGEEDE